MSRLKYMLLFVSLLCLPFFLACSAAEDTVVDGDGEGLDGDLDGDVDGDGESTVDGDELSDGDGAELDGDVEQELEAEFDLDIEIPDAPTSHPVPDGEAAHVFDFTTDEVNLSRWRQRDAGTGFAGAADWTLVAEGLVQWDLLNEVAEVDPLPSKSDFMSTEVRQEQQPFDFTALQMELIVGLNGGGFGLTLGDGDHQVLLCFDEEACGGSFVRWTRKGRSLALEEVAFDFPINSSHSLLVSIIDGWGLVSVDDEYLLAAWLGRELHGTVGIFDYLVQGLVVESLSVWGETTAKRTTPMRDWAVIAHRGYGNSGKGNPYPENTIPAAQMGHAMGADYLEIDVNLTADDVPVVIHDTTLNGTTDCSGPVADKTWAEVSLCLIDDKSPWAGEDIGVPRLDDMIDQVPGARWFIEIKSVGDDDANQRLVEEVMAVMADKNLLAESWVISFNYEMLAAAKEIEQDVQAAWVLVAQGDDTIADALEADIDALDLGTVILDADYISTAHEAGLDVYIWTVDQQSAFEQWIEDGVDGITTNRPARLAATAWP